MECRLHRTGADSDEIPRRRRTGLVRDNQTDVDCGTGRPGGPGLIVAFVGKPENPGTDGTFPSFSRLLKSPEAPRQGPGYDCEHPTQAKTGLEWATRPSFRTAIEPEEASTCGGSRLR